MCERSAERNFRNTFFVNTQTNYHFKRMCMFKHMLQYGETNVTFLTVVLTISKYNAAAISEFMREYACIFCEEVKNMHTCVNFYR